MINALKQKHSANTSPKPGFTKALQKLKIAPEIYVFDTPGVIPYGERDPLKHALMAAADPNIIKDPDIVAMHIIERFYKENKSVFEIFYGIEMAEDPVETLERLAKRLNALKKGGKPDIMKTARKIIEDWQRGKVIL
ncbi:50S ribosome-binding GTPase [Candidatus Woesearchaeota archaeon]|nr:50S ribosome-binding GTPase [Candidatus Woesearchaeota archaeon]